jgi:hypothetical protein
MNENISGQNQSAKIINFTTHNLQLLLAVSLKATFSPGQAELPSVQDITGKKPFPLTTEPGLLQHCIIAYHSPAG